ncbi:MAG: M48 family metallopeptidase [Dechloromonas sp.]|nr:M48 family metallopeptidase [Dechloromonas sp.]
MPPITPPEPARSIVIGGLPVAYQLRRSQRRTIGLTVDHRGLRVGAPTRARIGDIETLIHEHGQWVLDKLAAWRDRPAQVKLAITNGTVLSILGEPLTVAFTDVGRNRWQFGPGTLYLRPDGTHPASELLEKALREKARTVFTERLAVHAPLIGVATPPLRLSSARTRWGSCSHRGGIALNWRLVLMPLAIVDYVVCHELAHLREMNHSPRFWAEVEKLCPDWRQLRLELRQLAPNLPRL